MELEEPFWKRARASGGGGACSASGPDRLSVLPECLIHAIMSFMKEQVVQTCVLSKRWRHLWHSVPCHDIDFDELKKTSCASDDNPGSGGKDNSGSDDDVSDSDSDSLGSDADDNKKHKDKDKYKYKD